MKRKWLIDVVIAVAAVATLAVWLLCFPPVADAPATAPEPSAPIATQPSEPTEEDDVYIPKTLSFTGKVLELDGDSVLMKCLDSDRFDTVWANISGMDVTPQVGEEYTVTYEDLVMPSLPPRITAVKMDEVSSSGGEDTQGDYPESSLNEDEYISGDFICRNVDDGVEIVKHYNGDSLRVEVPAKIDGRSVVSLGANAFYQHKVLKTVVLPEGLKRMMGSCFYRCYSLEKAVIPSTVTEIDGNPFWRASSLAQIEVAEGNSAFRTKDGVLYDFAGETLIAYPEGKQQESFTIPDEVMLIREDAFGYHPQTKSLYLTKTVRLESVYLTAHSNDLRLYIYKDSPADKMLQELEGTYHPYEYR